MLITRYSLAHRLLWEVRLDERHYESPGCCCPGATLQQHHSYVIRGYVMPPLRLCSGCCYDCCVSQERVNVSAVPTAPPVFFQPLISSISYPGFSEQQDSWHHYQDQQYRNHTHVAPNFLGMCFERGQECFTWSSVTYPLYIIIQSHFYSILLFKTVAKVSYVQNEGIYTF